MNKFLKSNFNVWHGYSYIWLMYLFYPLANYLPLKNIQDVIGLTLIILFVIAYITVNQLLRYLKYTVLFELTIITGFIFFAGVEGVFLLIFSGWQVPAILSDYARKYFWRFCGLYYGIVVIGFLKIYLSSAAIFKVPIAVFSLLFSILIAPPLSYFLFVSEINRRNLNETNRRLEAIVRRGERDRIARDLHDTLGQSFSMITVKAELAKKLLEKRPVQVAQELDDIARTSRQNLQLIREIVDDLYQKSLSEVLLEQSRNLAQAELILRTKGETAALKWPTKVQSKFAEVIPEAITNIIRHAHAHEVFMEFSEDSQVYQTIVHDDGYAKGYERPGAKGITGMAQRLSEFGGSFAINRQFNGTDVIFKIFKEIDD